jgi:hypothetical protein
MPDEAVGQLFAHSLSAVHFATHFFGGASGFCEGFVVAEGIVVGSFGGGCVGSAGASSLDAHATTMKTARSEEPEVKRVALRTVLVCMHCRAPFGKAGGDPRRALIVGLSTPVTRE